MNGLNDREYKYYVMDILDNDEFKKINNIEHHGTTRLEHSIRVSYYSYKISKLLLLNYEKTARAGLLHDFFISKEDRTIKDIFLSTFTHPKESVKNSKNNFDIDEIEENIIKSHMFPLYTSIPKYAESWVVTLVDKAVATYEFSLKFSTKISYAANLFLLLILNNMR